MEHSDTEIIVKIQDLKKVYAGKSGEVVALQDINLDIYKGEIFGIIGMSGAGKSTLVRCINLLERPTDGKVFVDGKDITTLNLKELSKERQSIGMIFQQFNLLMQKTVLKNVCFPMEIAKVDKDKSIERAKELLNLVELSDKANSYPAMLSGGQKQRVAIARALAMNPKVLLCDEATSALDPMTTRSILKLLKEINRNLGITVIIITHEMKVIEEICDRVAIIADSQIAEVGRVSDIFANPKSNVARRLIYPEGNSKNTSFGKKCIRIVFDGRSSFEPVISNMILECKIPVNIMFADTKDINGIAYGQMILQLPDDEKKVEKVVDYLKTKDMIVEEADEIVR